MNQTLHLPRGRDRDVILAYGRERWIEVNGRLPTFHPGLVIPESPFTVFALEGDDVGKIIETSYFVSQSKGHAEATPYSYGELQRLGNTAVACSVYLWVQANTRMPSIAAKNRAERTIAHFVNSVEERPLKFRKIQQFERDRGLCETASRLAQSTETTRGEMLVMLSTALAGCTARELEIFNRYFFVATRLRDEFVSSGAGRISESEWVYILSGDRSIPRLSRTIRRLGELLKDRRLVQDPHTLKIVPAGSSALRPGHRAVERLEESAAQQLP